MPDARLPLHTLRTLARIVGLSDRWLAIAITTPGFGGRIALIDPSTWRTQP